MDDRKLLSIAFLAISDQCATFFRFFLKWPPAAILDARFSPMSIGTSLYGRSVATSNMKLIGFFLLSHGVHKLFHDIFTKWPLAASLLFRFSHNIIFIYFIYFSDNIIFIQIFIPLSILLNYG